MSDAEEDVELSRHISYLSLRDTDDNLLQMFGGTEKSSFIRPYFEPQQAYIGTVLSYKSSSRSPCFCAVSWRSLSLVSWKMEKKASDGNDEHIDVCLGLFGRFEFPEEALPVDIASIESNSSSGLWKSRQTIVISREYRGIEIFTLSDDVSSTNTFSSIDSCPPLQLQRVIVLSAVDKLFTEPVLQIWEQRNDRELDQLLMLCLDRVDRRMLWFQFCLRDLIHLDKQSHSSPEQILANTVIKIFPASEYLFSTIKTIVNMKIDSTESHLCGERLGVTYVDLSGQIKEQVLNCDNSASVDGLEFVGTFGSS